MNFQANLFLDKPEKIVFELNSYLRIAYMSLLVAKRPLHAFDILTISERLGFMPNHLFGETQVKTLNARLSEHILEHGEKSLFFRTGKAVYFLKSLASKDEWDNRFLSYEGDRRERPIHEEKILVTNRNRLSELLYGGYVRESDVDIDGLLSSCFFHDRYAAELDVSLKQLVTYTIVKSRGRYLTYRRGKYSNKSENLIDTLSIAFGGHVSEVDFDLFNKGKSAILANSSREFLEELNWHNYYPTIDEVSSVSQLSGFINVDDNSDARQHFAAVVVVDHYSTMEPDSGELGISRLRWLLPEELLSLRGQFDLWSRLLIDRIDGGEFG